MSVEAWPPAEHWPTGDVVAEAGDVDRCACGEPRSPRATRCRLCEQERRARAKVERAERCRVLEAAGASVAEIAARLDLSKADVRAALRAARGHRQRPMRSR